MPFNPLLRIIIPGLCALVKSESYRINCFIYFDFSIKRAIGDENFPDKIMLRSGKVKIV